MDSKPLATVRTKVVDDKRVSIFILILSCVTALIVITDNELLVFLTDGVHVLLMFCPQLPRLKKLVRMESVGQWQC